MLAERSGGDARVALSALERAVERRAGRARSTSPRSRTRCSARRSTTTGQGDRHYDFISAWIKATRGTDVDASLYYLAVMLEGGEDPRFIARRMVILASEDIGNADPQALLVADAAARAVDLVGLPECALNLAQAAIYLALAPKSNASYMAIGAARAEVRENGAADAARLPARHPLPRAPRSSGAGSATTTRTTSPAASPTSRSSRRACRAALLRADRPRLRGGAGTRAWRRSVEIRTVQVTAQLPGTPPGL